MTAGPLSRVLNLSPRRLASALRTSGARCFPSRMHPRHRSSPRCGNFTNSSRCAATSRTIDWARAFLIAEHSASNHTFSATRFGAVRSAVEELRFAANGHTPCTECTAPTISETVSKNSTRGSGRERDTPWTGEPLGLQSLSEDLRAGPRGASSLAELYRDPSLACLGAGCRSSRRDWSWLTSRSRSCARENRVMVARHLVEAGGLLGDGPPTPLCVWSAAGWWGRAALRCPEEGQRYGMTAAGGVALERLEVACGRR